jgi:hypothetical protein
MGQRWGIGVGLTIVNYHDFVDEVGRKWEVRCRKQEGLII